MQPVLKKLKDNKDLDSITAANTAANVVMPSLTNLIQKSLQESERNSPANSTRKNSVVSFASSETSMPSDSKYTQQQTNTNQNSPEYQLISLPSTRDHSTVEMQPPSQQSSISHTLTGFGIGDDEIIPMEVEEDRKSVV